MTLYRLIIGDNINVILEEYLIYGDFLKKTFLIMFAEYVIREVKNS